MVRKLLALLCAGAMTLSLTACGENAGTEKDTADSRTESTEAENTRTEAESQDPEETQGSEAAAAGVSDTLNIAYSSDRGTMAPVWGSDHMGGCIYDVLYEIDYTPMLATEWEMTDDTHMVLKIWEGVKDTEGNPFTASDVVYSLNYATTDLVSSFYVPAIDFDNTKVIDDHTVEIALKAPDVDQWYLLANVRMFTQAAMEASEDGMTTHPVGTGPYKMVEYVPNSSLKLEANADYWGEVPYQYVNWYFISETAQRAVALESGQVDIAFGLGTSDYLRLQDEADYNVYSYPSGNHYVLYFNCSEHSIAANADFRRAVAYAVDGNAISQVVFSGLAPVSTYTYIEGAKGADSSWCADYYATDLEKAKELLTQAGIGAGTKIKVGSQSAGQHAAAAEVVQGILLELGLDVELVSYESATWDEVSADPENGMDILVNSVGCPDEYYGNVIRASMIMSKATHYENAELTALIEQSIQTLEEEKQLEVNRQINDILYEEVPFYSLINEVALLAYDGDVSGVEEMLSHDKKLMHLTHLHP